MDFLLPLAMQYPPVEDPFLAKAVQVLGYPIAAPIKTFSHGYGPNAEGDPKKKTIYVNKRSPYYREKDFHKLAALLAHEERHLGGGSEKEALERQLEVLEGFGPSFKDDDYKALVRRKLIEASLSK